MGTGSFPWVKRPGRGVKESVEVKERTELHLYSPSGPSWAVLGRTLHFYLTVHDTCTFKTRALFLDTLHSAATPLTLLVQHKFLRRTLHQNHHVRTLCRIRIKWGTHITVYLVLISTKLHCVTKQKDAIETFAACKP